MFSLFLLILSQNLFFDAESKPRRAKSKFFELAKQVKIFTCVFKFLKLEQFSFDFKLDGFVLFDAVCGVRMV